MRGAFEGEGLLSDCLILLSNPFLQLFLLLLFMCTYHTHLHFQIAAAIVRTLA